MENPLDRRRTSMIVEAFEAPVFVKAGKHIVQEVRGIADAVDFLVQWSGSRHDVRADALLRACVDVQAGKKPVSVVRENFIRFAKFNGIWENPEPVTPWLQTDSQQGRISV
jgi:hypothetical protein